MRSSLFLSTRKSRETEERKGNRERKMASVDEKGFQKERWGEKVNEREREKRKRERKREIEDERTDIAAITHALLLIFIFHM